MARRPLVPDKTLAVLLGSGLLVAGFVVLYDAWEGRGSRKPILLGPILPW